MEFRGTYTALVTPFRNGEVDFDGFKKLLAMQHDAGVAGVVPCGCTGEAATTTSSERRRLLDIALKNVGDAIRVIPGTGTNATDSTVALTKEAESAGAHAAMLITPYYNKPSQQGLYEHYSKVGEATSIPLILYNVPSRTGVTLAPETIARLFDTGRYAAIKEAAGSIEAVSEIRSRSAIPILSGDDPLTVPMMSLGATGAISVVSNVFPEVVREMVELALSGDFDRASALHYKLLPIMRAAFVETNPSPIKAMLAIKGIIENEVRPPLCTIGSDSMEKVRHALETFVEARSA